MILNNSINLKEVPPSVTNIWQNISFGPQILISTFIPQAEQQLLRTLIISKYANIKKVVCSQFKDNLRLRKLISLLQVKLYGTTIHTPGNLKNHICNANGTQVQTQMRTRRVNPKKYSIKILDNKHVIYCQWKLNLFSV